MAEPKKERQTSWLGWLILAGMGLFAPYAAYSWIAGMARSGASQTQMVFVLLAIVLSACFVLFVAVREVNKRLSR